MKKILTIGLDLASELTEHADFQSKTSLLDWDIVLFRPDIDGIVNHATDEYQGKASLSDTSSFRLRENCEHWRREIKQATDTGKTVLVFLAPLQEVYVASGERSYSGTGRNTRTTRVVGLYSNYESIPALLSQVEASGSSMKLAARGAEILAPYWDEFADNSRYEVLLTAEMVPACLLTKNGDKPVGAIYRGKPPGGTLLLLPDLDFRPEHFFEEDDDDDEGDHVWTSAAKEFAARLISSIVAMDRALRVGAEVTPEPLWATDARFALSAELELRTQLLEAETEVERAQRRKESITEALKTAGSYRALLFEKGKPLESAIIDALRLLGFAAKPYKDSESEFDVVFESEEGRLIGEAEGKDNKPVNIDKLRQLAMNIHEDLQREEVTSPAKGVLFGNGFRLQPLHDRSAPFTDKCQSAAASTGIALVFTPELFPLVQYLLTTSDDGYSRACRVSIVNSSGRVIFPSPPASASADALEVREDET
jgi:hypothetical protein